MSAIGKPHAVSMAFFFVFISVTLGITYWAARRTRTAEQFYAAGRTVSAGQNGFALASDYMSAAWFPLKNPAIVTITGSFLVGVVVSLLTREERAEAGFNEMVAAMTSGSRAH